MSDKNRGGSGVASDSTSWDAGAVMARGSNSDDPAAFFRGVSGIETTEGEPDQRQHWALPHHKQPGGRANAAAVRNARARFGQTQNLRNREAAQRHLFETHRLPSETESSEPRTGVFRMVPGAMARADVTDDGNTLVGYASVFNTWAEIDGVMGSFREQIDSKAFNRTLTNNKDQIKVLFNHGMDPSIGSKPLGKPREIKPDDMGLWTETPLDETSYNADIRASLRSGALDGMSFMFDVVKDEWDRDTEDGIPERTIREVRLYEFGPVTWPAYATTTAGIRSKGVYGVTPEPVSPDSEARSDAPPEPARDTSALEALKLDIAKRERELQAWDDDFREREQLQGAATNVKRRWPVGR